MQNLIKLVQDTGKAMTVPASAITCGIVRSLSEKEQEANPKGAAFVWLALADGQMFPAIVRERMGFILNKAGGASSGREVVTGADGERISVPRTAFSYAIEAERISDATGKQITAAEAAQKEKRGETVIREPATVFKTNLRSVKGVIDFYVSDSAADLLDRFGAEISEDDGGEEFDDDGNPVVDEAPAPKREAPKRTPAKRPRRKAA